MDLSDDGRRVTSPKSGSDSVICSFSPCQYVALAPTPVPNLVVVDERDADGRPAARLEHARPGGEDDGLTHEGLDQQADDLLSGQLGAGAGGGDA
jgi:hypothetical protein